MNFLAKVLLAFIAFHVIVTGGGLQFEQVPQAFGQGANDNDAQLVKTVENLVDSLTLRSSELAYGQPLVF